MPGFFEVMLNLVLALIAGACFAAIIMEIRRVRAVRTWPLTSGRVTSSRVTATDGYAGEVYGCIVDYEYTVDGSVYVGSEQLVGLQTSDRTRAQDLCEKYQATDELLIAYRPKEASRSVIAGGRRDEVGIGTILGNGAIGALALVWLAIRVL